MKIFALFLLASIAFAQEAPKGASDVASILENTKSVFIIEPKARAADYAAAFDFLRKDKPSQKMIVRTMSATYTNVTDVSASSEGTLLMIRFLSNQGNKTQIVPVEQVVEISYSP